MLTLLLVYCVLQWVGGDPQKCCTDRQFEATFGEFGGSVDPNTGQGAPIDGYNFMSYDYYARMLRVEAHMTQPDGSVLTTHILIDYKNGKEYVKTELDCTVLDTTEKMREPCVPASSRFLGNTTFGYGSRTLTTNNWQYQKANTDIVVDLVVTADSCIPMVEASFGTMNNAKTDVVYFITDFKPGIKDRAVFTIPNNCRPGQKMGGVVGRAVRAVKNFLEH